MDGQGVDQAQYSKAMKQQQAAQEKQQQIKEQRSAVMQQVLENDARVRLANIAAVKPEKAEQL